MVLANQRKTKILLIEYSLHLHPLGVSYQLVVWRHARTAEWILQNGNCRTQLGGNVHVISDKYKAIFASDISVDYKNTIF